MKDNTLKKGIAGIKAIKMTLEEKRTIFENVVKMPQPVESPWSMASVGFFVRQNCFGFVVTLIFMFILGGVSILKMTEATSPGNIVTGAEGEGQKISQQNRIDTTKVDSINSFVDSQIAQPLEVVPKGKAPEQNNVSATSSPDVKKGRFGHQSSPGSAVDPASPRRAPAFSSHPSSRRK